MKNAQHSPPPPLLCHMHRAHITHLIWTFFCTNMSQKYEFANTRPDHPPPLAKSCLEQRLDKQQIPEVSFWCITVVLILKYWLGRIMKQHFSGLHKRTRAQLLWQRMLIDIHINIFKFKSLLHNNNIGSGLISFVAVQSSSHSSAEIAKHYTITRIHEG